MLLYLKQKYLLDEHQKIFLVICHENNSILLYFTNNKKSTNCKNKYGADKHGYRNKASLHSKTKIIIQKN